MRTHTKIVTYEALFLLTLFSLSIYPNISYALILQGFIGVSLFNAFTIIFLFLFIPMAIVGVILRAVGVRKTNNGKHWELDKQKTIILFSKYIIYHFLLISIWLMIFQTITGDNFLSYLTPLASSKPIFFHIYLVIFAVSGPLFVYTISTLLKQNPFKPTAVNFLRLYIWNLTIFWAASTILKIPLF